MPHTHPARDTNVDALLPRREAALGGTSLHRGTVPRIHTACDADVDALLPRRDAALDNRHTLADAFSTRGPMPHTHPARDANADASFPRHDAAPGGGPSADALSNRGTMPP